MNKIGKCLIALCLLAPMPANAEVTQEDQQSINGLTPLQVEEAKLDASSNAVRFYVVRAVYPNLLMDEKGFRNLSDDEQSKMTSDAFYLATFKRATTSTWDKSLVDILNKFESGRMKELLIEFERRHYEMYKRWPDIAAVDVASITSRLSRSQIIR